MQSMEEQLLSAREQAKIDQEALLTAMNSIHVKDEESDNDQDHGGNSINN